MLMRFSIHKNILFGAILVAAVFIGLVAAGFFTVRASSATCFDITGAGQGVEVVELNFVPNSGVVYFDPIAAAPDTAYEACVEDEGAIPGNGPFTVKGWAWDDNLGWISMYCSGGFNLGIPCGGIDYGVMMDGPVGPNPGRLSGYAWGDNSGWVSFNCSDGGTCTPAPGGVDYWVEAETEPAESACWGEVFSFGIPPGCFNTNVDLSVFAWSDNVGWMDFSGVKFPWVEFSAIAVDVELEIKALGLTDLLAVDKTTAPVADGSDKYEMILHVTNQSDGLPINPADYTVTVTPVWVQDTVDTDQTDLVNNDHAFDNSGAVNKPLIGPDFGGYGAPYADAFVGYVTSLAPTSSMNGYDSGADGSVDFSYENFVLGNPNALSDVPPNDLVLSDVLVSVTYIPTGACAFGDPGCASKSVAGPYAGANFHFVPAVEVSEMNDSINGATITGAYLTPNYINYLTAKRGTLSGLTGNVIEFNMGIDSPFKLVNDLGLDGADCNDPDQFYIDGHVPFASVLSLFNIVPVWDLSGLTCALDGPPTGENVYIYSKVVYSNGGKVINYFSNKLPRVQGTLVVNPVAAISGNVYSTGVTNPQTGQEIRSLGDVGTNVLRNTLLQNVRGIVAGAADINGNASIADWDFTLDSTVGFVVNNANVAKLLPDIASIPKVYYFKGDTTIKAVGGDPSSKLSWNGERTIIVDGGNLFIDRNLYNAPPSFNKLGIIVLKNLATGTGGNIYVAPNVTNIQANMYADGSFFSYDGIHLPSENITGAGEPIFTDEATRFGFLKNQLFIEGSLASQNTIGGAVKTLPILGDGMELSSGVEGSYNPPSGRARARLYDLNFLRYYGLVFERDVNGDAVDMDGDGILEATPYGQGGDLVPIVGGTVANGLDSTKDFAAVYINFNPPSLTLPAFGSSGGVDIRIRP